MGLYSYRLVVDMIEGPHDLQERIFHICRKYKLALRRAKEVRFAMQQIVEQRLKDVNKDFIELVTTELQEYQDTSNIEVETPESGKMTSQDLSDDITLDNDARGQEQRRKQCEITVKIEINSCIPLKGNTVRDVDDEFCKILQQNTTLPRKLGKIHPGLAVKHGHHGNGSYVMKCQSREALECLMEEYGSKRLSEMVETTLIMEADLDDIGFTYISLDTRIDYKEYLTCKDEVPDITTEVTGTDDRSAEDVAEGDTMTDKYTPSYSDILYERVYVKSKITEQSELNIMLKQIKRAKRMDRDITIALIRESLQEPKDEKTVLMEFIYLKQEVRQKEEELVDEREKLLHVLEKVDAVFESVAERRNVYIQIKQVEKGLPQKGTIRVFTGEDTQAGKLREPWGLFVRNNGDFVVTDNGRVSVYDCQFHCKHIIQFNSFDEKFYPYDVFVSKDGIFYIPDHNNNSLVICNEDSKIKYVLQLTYQNRRISPRAVCVSMGYIYTIDDHYVHCIDGESHDVIKSSHLSTGGGLNFICGNTKGNIMVSEYSRTRPCIHILDKDLNTLTQLSHHLIKEPRGICTDDSDNLFVCEWKENRILEFNVMGEFIGTICDGDDVKSPRGIAVNADCIAWTEGGKCVKVLYR
ncbi:uncharacterized protein LOC144450265 [Glandiceps talaboti]